MRTKMSYDGEKLTFNRVEDPAKLLPVLEERLPKSCFVYNQVILCPNFEDITFYTLGSEISSKSWIIVIYFREDHGSYFSISAPTSIIDGTEPIPYKVMEAFSFWEMIDWDGDVLFYAIEKQISSMILEICVNVKGNVTGLHPCILYCMDKDEALGLEVMNSGPDFQIQRLRPEEDTDFIVKSWKYSRKGTDTAIRKIIKGAPSAGVFIDGKCVSGVVTAGIGLISHLYTVKDYRNRGFAKMTMNFVIRENAKEGCIPSSIAEARNDRSIAFHHSIGANPVSLVDIVELKKKLETD